MMTSVADSGAVGQGIIWSDDLMVGIPEIDADHRVLVELINQINSSGDDPEAFSVIGTVLAALADYTEYHFAREEIMQRVANYPGQIGHSECHDILKRQVQHYLGLYSLAPEGVDVGELFLFLKRWLFEHIMHEDMLYVPFCAGNEAAIDALRSVGLDFFMDSELSSF